MMKLIRPMLAESIDQPFDSRDYLFEPKWDGFRCIAYLERDRTILYSRSGRDFSHQFPELLTLHRRARKLPAILDGEIVAFTAGKPDFHALLHRSRRSPSPQVVDATPVNYLAFDLLHWDGAPLLSTPLLERRTRLKEGLVEEGPLLISPFVPTQGISLYQVARQQGLEGIVAKALNSPYLPGKRSRLWLKCKVIQTLEACILGFTPKGDSLASLALGLWNFSHFDYIGHVGTGFTDSEAQAMRRFFSAFVLRRSQLAVGNVDEKTLQTTVWVVPQTVCEVRFFQLTPEGRLRHPSFVCIRPDKRPQECTWQQISQGKDETHGKN